MKSFLGILLVVCGLIAAAWFFYDPYLKPLLEGAGGKMADQNAIIQPGANSVVPMPPKTKATPPVVTAPPKTLAPKPVAATPPKSELDLALEVRYPMPEILPLLTIVDQWRNVPPNAYPPEIFGKETIPFQLVINGQVAGSSNVAPGTPLKPVRLLGDQLTVSSLANPGMSTQVPVDKTDFKERIESRYGQFVAFKTKEVETKRERVRKMVAADPGKLALLTGKAAPAASAAGESADTSGDPRFAPVKASLRNGEAASVTLEETTSFRWNGSEKVGGEFSGTYDTVTVHFEVKTIFGKFPTEYKALLKGGKVIAWIDPFTEDRV
ncbi:MAG: hypothetical protein KBF76_06235 [Verrucomicrobiales bacterium]|nr:hypothetical protein [Verrucomicrobiales bacterium]